MPSAGEWPSGKAADSGSANQRFESSLPSQVDSATSVVPRCAFRFAVTHGYATVVQCDADGQHDPSEIHRLLETMHDSEAELVIGSRFAAGRPHDVGLGRRFAMGQLARTASRETGAHITNATSGFRAIGGMLLGAFAANYPSEYLSDPERGRVHGSHRRDLRVLDALRALDSMHPTLTELSQWLKQRHNLDKAPSLTGVRGPLRNLKYAGLVRFDHGYRLTERGRD